ncbi:MAG TPA: hypothetical protein VK165_11470 [Azonexus sp.]|nr:hypothetical protein [Azonexus sp.]
MPYIPHPIITKDYPENAQRGVMICGINFGYSDEDKKHELAGVFSEAERLSFFSDSAVNNTRFRNRILTWLSSWDIELATSSGNETMLERSFFQTNWLNTQTNSITSDSDITTAVLVREADGVLNLLNDRKPRIIFLVGSRLIEALNDISLRERVESIFGIRSGNALVHRTNSSTVSGKRFKLLTQSFGHTKVIGLPHVQTRGLTDEYIASFKPIIQSQFRSL